MGESRGEPLMRAALPHLWGSTRRSRGMGLNQEDLWSSPFIGRWRKAPEGLVQDFTSPLAGEVGPKGRVGRSDN